MNNSSSSAEVFYDHLWRTSQWGMSQPNTDEASRANVICEFIEKKVLPNSAGSAKPQILDVGCGRGWLSQILSNYGDVKGIDPIAASIERAHEMYPKLDCQIGAPQDFIADEKEKYDLIVSSEVIEHVPDIEKSAFLISIYTLLKKGGFVILTTPRGELWGDWKKLLPKGQPIEAWVSEMKLDRLARMTGFIVVNRSRAHVYHRPFNFLSRVVNTRYFKRIHELFPKSKFLSNLVYACKIYQVVLLQKNN